MNKINEYSFHTKDDMLNKLRAYTHNPDDDNIRIKIKYIKYYYTVQNYCMQFMMQSWNPNYLTMMEI